MRNEGFQWYEQEWRREEINSMKAINGRNIWGGKRSMFQKKKAQREREKTERNSIPILTPHLCMSTVEVAGGEGQ